MDLQEQHRRHANDREKRAASRFLFLLRVRASPATAFMYMDSSSRIA